MIDTIDKPLRFIHIKKNGGTSVFKFLRKNNVSCLIGSKLNTDRNVAGQHSTAKKYESEDSFKFCVVRNPYTRLVSFYNWIKRFPNYQFSFEHFVDTKFNTRRATAAWGLQCEYIYADSQFTINLIDKIFKFETMEEDIKKFFKIDNKFPHLNRCTFNDYNSYYTEKTRNIVYEHFKKDFDLLGYSYDGH